MMLLIAFFYILTIISLFIYFFFKLKIQRTVGYEKAVKEVSKWTSAVIDNRKVKPHPLFFKDILTVGSQCITYL